MIISELTSNRENIRKWVDGLRSKRFKQGYGVLTNIIISNGSISTMENCCLGVACEIARENGVSLEIADKVRYYTIGNTRSYDGEFNYLPARVREWLGIDDPDPWIPAAKSTLSEINDQRTANFDEIAALLEQTYLT